MAPGPNKGPTRLIVWLSQETRSQVNMLSHAMATHLILLLVLRLKGLGHLRKDRI